MEGLAVCRLLSSAAEKSSDVVSVGSTLRLLAEIKIMDTVFKVVAHCAKTLFLYSQHLLILRLLPLLRTIHPCSQLKFILYISVAPRPMAFLSCVHDLCITWQRYGGWVDKLVYEDQGWQ